MFDFIKRKIGLSKDKKYSVENRRYEIKDKTNDKTLKKFLDITIEEIINLTQKEKIFSKFTNLKITLQCENSGVLKDSSKIGGTINHPDELILDLTPIKHPAYELSEQDFDFNLEEYIQNYDIESYKKELQEVLVHEAYHLIHFQKNKSFEKRYYDSANKLVSFHKKDLDSKSEEINSILLRLRKHIKDFLTRTWAEGVAEFLEGLYNKKIYFDRENFQKFYQESKKDLKKLKKEFNKIKYLIKKGNNNEIKRDLLYINHLMKNLNDFTSYRLGRHIFFSLRYLSSEINNEYILKKDVKEIILIYEELMEANGYQPLVSLYSNKRFFDYKNMLMSIAVEFKIRMGLI